jgi:hypothetical protein
MHLERGYLASHHELMQHPKRHATLCARPLINRCRHSFPAFAYLRTIKRGGSYTVANENLAQSASLLAAAPLMIDYILTAVVGSGATESSVLLSGNQQAVVKNIPWYLGDDQ